MNLKMPPNTEGCNAAKPAVTKRALFPWFSLFALLNGAIPYAVTFVGQMMRNHWREVLPGKRLPECTLIALGMPPFFYAFTVLSILGCGAVYHPRTSLSALIQTALAVGLCELLALVLFVARVAWPAGRIFYGIGPGA